MSRTALVVLVLSLGPMLDVSPTAASPGDPDRTTAIPSRIQPGDVVSVRLTTGEHASGVAFVVSDEGIVLIDDGRSRKIPMSTITRVTRQRGTHGVSRGLVIGGLIGFLAGNSGCYDVDTYAGHDQSCGGSLAGGVAIGAGLGALAGWAMTRPDVVYEVPGSATRDREGFASLPKRPRREGEQLLLGREPLTDFEQVLGVLRPGHEIIVHDDSGRSVRGHVLQSSDGQLIVRRPAAPPLKNLFARQPSLRSYPEASVARIEVVDSTRTGTLLGMAAGAGAAYGIHVWEDRTVPDTDSLKGLATVVFGTISFVLSTAIGGSIDLHHNRTIYRAPSAPPPRIAISPAYDGGAVSVSARIAF